MLLRAPAGIGVTRFLDEATRRVGALDSPVTILRAGTLPAGTDVPYGPIVRAVGPAIEALDDDELARVVGPAAAAISRLFPTMSTRLDPLAMPMSRPVRSGAPHDPHHGGRPRDARSARGARADPAHPRGPPPGRPGDARPGHVPGSHRGRPTPRARPVRPARRRHARPSVDLGRGRHGRGATTDRTTRVAGPSPRRAGLAHRGDRGRTGVGQPAAARRRAIRWQPAPGRGAARRATRAADGVIDGIPRRDRRRSDGHPFAGVPARAAPPRPRRSRPRYRPSGGRGRGLRDDDGSARAAFDQLARSARTAPSTASSPPVSPRRSSTASWSSGTGGSGSATSSSGRPSSATSCRSPGRGTTPAWRSPWPTCRPLPPTTGSRPATRAAARLASSTRRCGGRDGCRRQRAGRPRVGAVSDRVATAAPGGADPGGPAALGAPGSGRRGRLCRGPPVTRDGVLRVVDRRARYTPRAAHRRSVVGTARPGPPRGRRPDRGHRRRPSRRGPRPAGAVGRSGDRAGHARAAAHGRRHLQRVAAARPRGHPVATACDPVARAQEVHATTTLAVAMAWGRDPQRPIEMLTTPSGPPRRSATRRRSSGCRPT